MIEKADLLNAVNAAALMYGGINDYKHREIPNIVPICFVITGLIAWNHVMNRLACMAAVAVILLLAAKISKSVPGGDFKLVTAVAFYSGLIWTGMSLVAVGILFAGITIFARESWKRTIPLGTYLAAAYFSVGIILFPDYNYKYFSGFLLLYVVLLWLARKQIISENKIDEEDDK